jgi:hypothetical protein
MKAPEQVLQALSFGAPAAEIIFFSIMLIKYEKYYGGHLKAPWLE